MDEHWMEVMALAEKYGFIMGGFGGTAILATHRYQKEVLGENEYLRIQEMNGRKVVEEGQDNV